MSLWTKLCLVAAGLILIWAAYRVVRGRPWFEEED